MSKYNKEPNILDLRLPNNFEIYDAKQVKEKLNSSKLNKPKENLLLLNISSNIWKQKYTSFIYQQLNRFVV